MSTSETPAAPSSTISSSRLETFSDGVFAIAATLLILDVRAGPGELGARLLHNWPSYVAYAVSFLTIGIIWINHHTVFTQIRRVDRLFLLINVAFLMLVAFIPFPTSLIASHLTGTDLEPAALTYGATLTITAIFFNLALVLCRPGPSPAPNGCRAPSHQRHLPELPARPADLPRGDPHRSGQPDRQRRRLRSHHDLLHHRELHLRPIVLTAPDCDMRLLADPVWNRTRLTRRRLAATARPALFRGSNQPAGECVRRSDGVAERVEAGRTLCRRCSCRRRLRRPDVRTQRGSSSARRPLGCGRRVHGADQPARQTSSGRRLSRSSCCGGADEARIPRLHVLAAGREVSRGHEPVVRRSCEGNAAGRSGRSCHGSCRLQLGGSS